MSSPADVHSTPVDGVDVIGALSPSRAGDFMTCPLLYRYRSIDKLPEAPSPAAVRGTVVHKVLEDLFDLAAAERTPERAREMLAPSWEALLEAEPGLAEMFAGEDGPEIGAWLAECRQSLEKYFELEDPTRLEPAERELYVEALLDSKLLIRGFVDRLDVAPDGRIRVVDYKGLAVDTPIPTPAGWTTMGELRVGDVVFGADGLPARVTVKSGTHRRPCYRVEFLDGSSVVCDNVHLWTVISTERQRQTRHTLATDDLAALVAAHADAGRRQSVWVEAADSCMLPEVDLAIPPYLLGAWLGDGDSRSGSLTVGAEDIDDMLVAIKAVWPTEVLVRREKAVFRVTPTHDSTRCRYGHDDWIESNQPRLKRRCRREPEHVGAHPTNVGLTALLRSHGLFHNKHIPPLYLRASKEQRIELLRGLLDTDGWWNATRNRAGFTTTCDALARDVVELLRTLGITPLHFEKPYENAVRPDRTWHVIEFTPQGFNPFHLLRKALPVVDGITDLQIRNGRRRIITAVTPVESVPTQCIAVDAEDSLYLCGHGFIPTHNTGRAPGEGFEAKALFQMKFYALVWWKTRGVIPAMLQLIYLGNGEVLRYSPDEADLRATERKVDAIFAAIRRAQLTGDWKPNKSRLCDWCSFQAHCPEFGGEILPLPMFREALDGAGELATDLTDD